MDISDAAKTILFTLAAVACAGLAFKFVISRRNKKQTSIRLTSQKNNVVFGDMVGGDKKTEK